MKKQEILEVAMRLFVMKGYEKTSTNDILKELNLSRGGLYHHFHSKEEILDSAIVMLLQAEKERSDNILNNPQLTAIDKIKFVSGFSSKGQPLADEMQSMIQNPTLITHLLKKKLELVTPMFQSIIEQGIKEGVFKCDYPKEYAEMIVILSTLLFTNTVIYDDFMNMVKAFQSMIEKSLGVVPGTLSFMEETIDSNN